MKIKYVHGLFLIDLPQADKIRVYPPNLPLWRDKLCHSYACTFLSVFICVNLWLTPKS
jgi:hypothetical protein